MAAKVHLVHCVDTEGPLYESLGATFERLKAALGLTLTPSRETLKKIQAGELDLGSSTDAARRIVSPQNLDYMHDWGVLDGMLDELLSDEFRKRHADSAGGGYRFSWFVMDHVGYVDNPRRRDIGYHNIFDHYRERLATQGGEDELHWHFHPMNFGAQAHVCATSFLNSPHLLEGLARRIIDRTWFPCAFRAGFHAERPDSHWFLEQWLPIDFSNQAVAADAADDKQRDIADGRYGDWRRAPREWTYYHPSHDDYQRPGACNRVIFRCLNVGTRLRLLNRPEVEAAFERAAAGEPAVLAFCDHDWRDMRRDVAEAYSLVSEVAARYPKVEWRNSGARAAAREVLGWERSAPFRLSAKLKVETDRAILQVESNGPTFGPQPFLALRTWDGRYLADNFDVQEPRRRWTYVFDSQTLPFRAVDKIGVASCGGQGTVNAVVLDSTGAEASRWDWA